MNFTKEKLTILHTALMAHIASTFGHRGNSAMLAPDVLKQRDVLDEIAAEVEREIGDAPAETPEPEWEPLDRPGLAPSSAEVKRGKAKKE